MNYCLTEWMKFILTIILAKQNMPTLNEIFGN